MENNIKLSKESFEFVQQDAKIFDKPPETKPIGFYRDAWRRFKRNKASVVAACMILVMILFSLIFPLFSRYPLEFYDPIYKNMLPKNAFSSAVIDKDGGKPVYEKDLGIGVAAADFNLVGKPAGTPSATIEDGLNSKYSPVSERAEEIPNPGMRSSYGYKLDTYLSVGFIYGNIDETEYNAIKAWQAENNCPILFPVIALTGNSIIDLDYNIWYKTDDTGFALNASGGYKGVNDEYINNYYIDRDGNYTDWAPSGKGGREVRMLAYNYFIYQHGTEPRFTLGTDNAGRDIIIRLARGIRTSVFLAASITVVCFVIGAVIGAIEGYYGGMIDMVAQRITEVLVGIPFFVILLLVREKWIIPGLMSPLAGLFLLYISTAWIGNAGLLRSQFYRFKHQEYVLAARTLGARDSRIMFKHIFPNTLGTIITSVALDIPSFIFGETQLAYLGILKLDTASTASLGGMISMGQSKMYEYPHALFWPALVIALLMVSFNLFGNGLRDAFNPQLRGVE